MEEHGVVALLAGRILDESGTTALDLDTTSCLLLDVLDIGSAMAYNLGSEIETRDWLKTNWEPLFGPFALFTC